MDETSRRITFVVFPIELILDFLFSPLPLCFFAIIIETCDRSMMCID